MSTPKWKEEPMAFCFIKMTWNARKEKITTAVDIHLPDEDLFQDALIVALQSTLERLYTEKGGKEE